MEGRVVHKLEFSSKGLDKTLGFQCDIATVSLKNHNVLVLDIFTMLVLFNAARLESTTVAEVLAVDAAESRKECRNDKGRSDLERAEHLRTICVNLQ